MDNNNLPHGNYMENFEDTQKGKSFPGAILNWQQNANIFHFFCKETTLQLTVVNDKIIRFRYANNAIFEGDFSYAIDPSFKPEPKKTEVSEHEDYIVVSTAELNVWVNKQTLGTTITNKNGLSILEDELGYHWQKHTKYSGNIVLCTKKINSGEQFHGLGDKPGALMMRGKRVSMWGSDTYAYGPNTDPIYKNIPFFIGLHHKLAYGVFLDNTFRTWFDFGSERQNVFSYWAQGGEMNYYFIYGPQVQEVAETYTNMTGKPELPPLWALGYQQSKWSYYPEKVVKDLAAEFRKRKIPCDVIHLDIDYMEGFRCFTWNKEHFPDCKTMLSELKKDGFKPVCIIDPGIKIDPDYKVFQEGLAKDYFCRTADGPLFRGSVWPGICNFPDFTNPEVREWWRDLFEELISQGISGVWNDMNEPAVFEEGTFPADIRHDYDGHPCSHRKAHNIYGMQMSKATYEGVKKFTFPNRPFTLTRSTYSGGQRYAAGWTGDNVASWEHLTIANIQCQRLSLSGFSFIGSDVGGFVESPSGELYTRWVQLAIFHPFLRTHSSGDHGAQEPWSFGPEVESIVREALELRYRLLPYMYTAFWQYATFGTPMVRSLFMLDQRDPDTYYRQDEFALGDSLLTSPVTQPDSKGRWVYLPYGEWYSFWDDKRYSTLGEEIWVDVTKRTFPFFVKSGTVLPLGPPMQYVGEKEIKCLDLHVYYTTAYRESTLYEDAGEGYEYQQEGKNVVTFILSGESEDDMLVMRQSREGGFKPSYTEYQVIIHGLTYTPSAILADGKEVKYSKNQQTYTLKVPFDFEEIQIPAGKIKTT